jgi:predicted nucleotidyltransferase
MEKSKIDSIKNTLKNNNSILMIYLFGSQVKGNTNKYSDIDIAILFDNEVKEHEYTDKQIDIAANLSKILNREIDVIILNRASLFLKYHVLKEGIKIYEHPDRSEHNFEARSIMEYLDFLPIKIRIENGMLAKIKEA